MRLTCQLCVWFAATVLATSAVADDSLPPPVGTIEFYGLGPIPRAKAVALLPFKLGEQLPRGSPKRNGDAMAHALGVRRVEFAFICCSPDGKVEAYVGIEPHGAKPLEYNPAPDGEQQLPPDLLAAADAHGEAISAAVLAGEAREDDSQGHALSSYPPARAQEEKFIAFSREHADLLRDVLAHAADARHRAVAAGVLGYAPDKRSVVAPLMRAALDADSGVRNNATRALGVIALYASAHPELGIHVDPAPFIDMLNSVVWTDRNKGSFVLMAVSATRDPAVLERLRRDALPALIEMCAWTNLGHAVGACLMLQRVLGLSDDPSEQNRSLALERARRLIR